MTNMRYGHPSYSSVSYVDLPKRTPREPKIRNERNSHPIGRKNCLGNHFWPGVFLFLIGTFIKSWKISLSQMSSPLVPLAKYWRMLINRSWSCWEFPSSMHCKIGDDNVEHTPAFWSCWPFRQLPRYAFILLALHQHNKVLILQNIFLYRVSQKKCYIAICLQELPYIDASGRFYD